MGRGRGNVRRMATRVARYAEEGNKEDRGDDDRDTIFIVLHCCYISLLFPSPAKKKKGKDAIIISKEARREKETLNPEPSSSSSSSAESGSLNLIFRVGRSR